MAAARRPPSSEPAKVQLRAADGDGTQLALGGVVGHAEAAVVEEAGERGPALEAVVDGLGGLALGRRAWRAARAARSPVRRRAAGCARCARARRSLRRQAVDLALDGEQRIDALDRLDRDRRLVEPRQIEELAPRMRPARRLDDRPRLAVGRRRAG